MSWHKLIYKVIWFFFNIFCYYHYFCFIYIANTFLYHCRLMFDPYAKIVYDYTGGMEDIRKAKVCMYFIVVKCQNFLINLNSLHCSSLQNFICRCALCYLQIFLLWRTVVSICFLFKTLVWKLQSFQRQYSAWHIGFYQL